MRTPPRGLKAGLGAAALSGVRWDQHRPRPGCARQPEAGLGVGSLRPVAAPLLCATPGRGHCRGLGAARREEGTPPPAQEEPAEACPLPPSQRRGPRPASTGVELWGKMAGGCGPAPGTLALAGAGVGLPGAEKCVGPSLLGKPPCVRAGGPTRCQAPGRPPQSQGATRHTVGVSPSGLGCPSSPNCRVFDLFLGGGGLRGPGGVAARGVAGRWHVLWSRGCGSGVCRASRVSREREEVTAW